ncbi:MAG: hypothetical protein P9L99_03815 [Candidatus Lernaella stagnicola]|nr:hypothetical protein [Candidatus Lernaella stagnicola]
MAKKAAILIAILFGLYCLFSLAYFYLFAHFQTGEQELQFREADAKTLVVTNERGLIQIEGEERDTGETSLTKIVDPRLPWLGDLLLSQVTATSRRDGDTWYVAADAPRNWRGSAKVDMQFFVPASMAVQAESVEANVTVRGVSGPVQVNQTGPSAVVLEDVTGPTVASVGSGTLRASLGSFDEHISLSAREGKLLVNLNSPHPGPMKIESKSANILMMAQSNVNATLSYRSRGVIFNQFDQERVDPARGDGEWIVMKLGTGGVAIVIDGGDGDLTIQYFDDVED